MKTCEEKDTHKKKGEKYQCEGTKRGEMPMDDEEEKCPRSRVASKKMNEFPSSTVLL
jgi:hypothetical protein